MEKLILALLKCRAWIALVAQWIERQIADLKVVSSSLTRRTVRRVRIVANCTSFENSREKSLHRFKSCTLRQTLHSAARCQLAALVFAKTRSHTKWDLFFSYYGNFGYCLIDLCSSPFYKSTESTGNPKFPSYLLF